MIYDVITAEIIKNLTVLKANSDESSEQVLVWVLRVEAQRAWKAVLENIRAKKNFDQKR